MAVEGTFSKHAGPSPLNRQPKPSSLAIEYSPPTRLVIGGLTGSHVVVSQTNSWTGSRRWSRNLVGHPEEGLPLRLRVEAERGAEILDLPRRLVADE